MDHHHVYPGHLWQPHRHCILVERGHSFLLLSLSFFFFFFFGFLSLFGDNNQKRNGERDREKEEKNEKEEEKRVCLDRKNETRRRQEVTKALPSKREKSAS